MRVKAILAVLLALSWAVLAWLWIRTSRQNAQVRSLDEQLRAAQAKAPPPPPPAPVPATAGPVSKPAEPPRRERHAAPEPAVNPEVETLRAKLQESAANLARLQARVTELESEVLNVMAERARGAAAEKDANAKVAELTRTLDSMNADRPAAEKRIHDLEAETARLREQNAAAAQKNTQAGQLSAELVDITRRQQVYVTNIVRRYREVTDMFRTLPETNGPEVSRIQTAMSMAEEDVRQLNDLSARLGRLEKRISDHR